MGKFPMPLAKAGALGLALIRASIASTGAWKDDAACKGRLPRSLARLASAGKLLDFARVSRAPKPLQSSCRIVSVILEKFSISVASNFLLLRFVA